ncbi:MAG TPA: four-carbon acid sugar kinase family protein [Advenella sp.]|nr:four-carbon acid sugar kinase family protein [Advenella sp.]
MSLKFGWYGDDFTGATDTLAVAARANLRSILFLDVPTEAQLAHVGILDAIGIAGTARGMSPQQMQVCLPKIGRFFHSQRVPVLHYKCCSTFDSAVHTGSLGAAVNILGDYVAASFALFVGGQPDIGRYCCFGNLFAAAGHSGQVHRLDRHPTMQCHPVTPMHEADLRLHLQSQAMADVRNIPYTAYGQQVARLDALVDDAVRRCGSGNGKMDSGVLFDVSDSAQLASVGRQILRIANAHGTALVVGSSVVLQALAAAEASGEKIHSASGDMIDETQRVSPGGPTFVLAGSLSPVTAAQVRAARGYVKLPLLARPLLDDATYRAAQCQRIVDELGADRHVLAYVDQQRGRDSTIPSAELAAATARFVSRTLQLLSEQGGRLGQLGIAGGDTSSQAIAQLDVWALSYSGVLSPGVTVCSMHSDDPALDGLTVMLKGGQMGSEDIFDNLLHVPATCKTA